MRIAIARLWFCSNSFAARRTNLSDLAAHELYDDDRAFARAEPGSELDGVARFLSKRPNWHATVLRSASAPPGGPLSSEAFGLWLEAVERGLRGARYDAVYLSLHGACQAEGDPQADVTIMRRLRSLIGRTPMVASFDMHANISPETALLLDGASANRVWPRGGGDAAAIRALKMLEAINEGVRRPVAAIARVPETPDASLAAEQGLADPALLDASVFWGFPWCDSPSSGPCAMVWTDRDAGLARHIAHALAQRMPRWRDEAAFRSPTPTPGIALRTALDARIGRFALLDTADDPMAGGLADTPEMLRVLLAEAPGKAAFGALHDPETVAAAWSVGVGKRLVARLGGRTTTMFGDSIEVEVEVVRLPSVSAALGGDMAVLRRGNVDILVGSTRPAVIGPDVFAAAGVRLDDVNVFAVKGHDLARIALTPLVSAVVACDCPGPASFDLSRLPFQNRSRPPERSDDVVRPVEASSARLSEDGHSRSMLLAI